MAKVVATHQGKVAGRRGPHLDRFGAFVALVVLSIVVVGIPFGWTLSTALKEIGRASCRERV